MTNKLTIEELLMGLVAKTEAQTIAHANEILSTTEFNKLRTNNVSKAKADIQELMRGIVPTQKRAIELWKKTDTDNGFYCSLVREILSAIDNLGKEEGRR